jgi:hypothetical protein
LFFFDLLCKRFSSSPCIGSAVTALFIKQDESLFRKGGADLGLRPSRSRRSDAGAEERASFVLRRPRQRASARRARIRLEARVCDYFRLHARNNQLVPDLIDP